MASHLFPGTTQGGGLLLRWTGIVLSHGGFGVDLFFVLSGFLITGILYDSRQEERFFRTFYARRVLRIFPLYYGVLLLLLLLTVPLRIRWQGMEWPLLLYLQNTGWIMPLYRFFPSPFLSLDHFWSLAVEEQFYLVWPLLVYLFREKRPIVVACLILSLVSCLLRLWLGIRGTDFNVINRGTMCRADALLMGAMLAIGLRVPRWHDRILHQAGRVAIGSAALFAAGIALRGYLLQRVPASTTIIEAVNLSLRYTVAAVFFTALLALCLRPESFGERVFSSSLPRYFGRYSYGLYVLHLIALPFLLGVFRHHLNHLTSNKGFAVVAAGLLSFAIAMLAAVLSYHFFERPFLRLKRYFAYDRSKAAPDAPVTS